MFDNSHRRRHSAPVFLFFLKQNTRQKYFGTASVQTSEQTPALAVRFHAISRVPHGARAPEASARELPQAAADHCYRGAWSARHH
jgi:hypothetical protein